MKTLAKDHIRKVFMDHGFTIKPGQTDLKPYVYAAARALAMEAIHEAAHTTPDKCPICNGIGSHWPDCTTGLG